MPFLLFWSLAFCVAGIGKGSLASWDEAYYALVSREIFRTGDWINLRYFDTPFYDKPPLYLWSTSFFYHLFGVSEFSTRLTSALAGVGVILVTYFLGKRLVGPLAALAGAGILLSSSDFLHYARWGTLDVTHLFSTGCPCSRDGILWEDTPCLIGHVISLVISLSRHIHRKMTAGHLVSRAVCKLHAS